MRCSLSVPSSRGLTSANILPAGVKLQQFKYVSRLCHRLSCNGSPISQWYGPFLPYIVASKVNRFFKGCVRWEHALVFCSLRIWRWYSSTVRVTRRISAVDWRYPVILSLLSRHDSITTAYSPLHFSSRLSNPVPPVSAYSPINMLLFPPWTFWGTCYRHVRSSFMSDGQHRAGRIAFG